MAKFKQAHLGTYKKSKLQLVINSWCRIVLHNLILIQEVTIFPHFMVSRRSQSRSQDHNTDPYSEPDVSSRDPPAPFKIDVNIIFPLAPHFSSFLCVPHTQPIAHSLILSPYYYFTIRKSHEAPHYARFSSLLSLPPSYTQRFSSVPYSQTTSAYQFHIIHDPCISRLHTITLPTKCTKYIKNSYT